MVRLSLHCSSVSHTISPFLISAFGAYVSKICFTCGGISASSPAFFSSSASANLIVNRTLFKTRQQTSAASRNASRCSSTVISTRIPAIALLEEALVDVKEFKLAPMMVCGFNSEITTTSSVAAVFTIEPLTRAITAFGTKLRFPLKVAIFIYIILRHTLGGILLAGDIVNGITEFKT